MQSRAMSLIESLCNVGSGFCVSLLLWEYIVCPWLNVERSTGQGMQVTALFTAVSIVRGYLWRRIFTRRNNVHTVLQDVRE